MLMNLANHLKNKFDKGTFTECREFIPNLKNCIHKIDTTNWIAAYLLGQSLGHNTLNRAM